MTTRPNDAPVTAAQEAQGAADPRHRPQRTEQPSRLARLLGQLGVEIGIGIGVAAVLVVAAWASSNAIAFVYGGY